MQEIVVEFEISTQSIGALREAAYRIIGEASCQIESADQRYRCRLTPKQGGASSASEALLRSKFLDFVTDENLREKIATETDPVRDVILALAFGSLVAGQSEPGTG